MNQPPQTAAGSRFAVLSLLCGAFLVSLAIYVVVAWALLRSGQQALPPGSAPLALPWVLTAVAAMLLVAGHVLGRRAIAPPLASPPADPAAALQQRTIVAFALREAVAIIGLVLSLLTGNFRWVAGFAAVAAVAMLMGWPRHSDLDASPRTGPPPIG